VRTEQRGWSAVRALRRLLRRTSGVLENGGDDPEAGSGPATEDDQGTRSEAELLLEEGMRPRAYLYHRVENAGGRVKQKRLVAESRLSEATASRLLTELESEDHLVRRRVGREKVVCLPECEPPEFTPSLPGAERSPGEGVD